MTLLLATPVRAAELMTAQVSLGYALFRERLARLMPTLHEFVFSLDVVRARNRIVGRVLSMPEFADVTHVLWVDDDQWPDDAAIVPEMMERCKGVLGAPYTNKREPLRWVHQPDGTGGAMVGMGFTMTSRVMLEQLAKGARWYTDLPNTAKVPDLFGQRFAEMGGETTLLSEDFSFCVRAREAGYSVELYTGAGIINHAGGHTWNARGIRTMPGEWGTK